MPTSDPNVDFAGQYSSQSEATVGFFDNRCQTGFDSMLPRVALLVAWGSNNVWQCMVTKQCR